MVAGSRPIGKVPGRRAPARSPAAKRGRRTPVPVAEYARGPYVAPMKRVELAQAGGERRLEKALEAAGLGDFEWNVARDVVAISPRMSAMLGLPAGEIPAEQGDALNQYVHPDDLPHVRAEQR